MTEVLNAYGKLSPVPIENTTPVVAKTAPTIASAVKMVPTKDSRKAPPFTGTTKDFKIEVAEGHKVDGRAYVPAGDGPFPTIFYIHGGGWVIGSVDSYDSLSRAICELTRQYASGGAPGLQLINASVNLDALIRNLHEL